MLMLEFKPDYAQSKQRIDAFWERELVDRPVVQFAMEKPPKMRKPLSPSLLATPAERCLDVQFQTEMASAAVSNQEFLGDSMPIAYPDLGASILSALYGCPLNFGDHSTSWSEPILKDWDAAHDLQLDWLGPYLGKLHELTDALQFAPDAGNEGFQKWVRACKKAQAAGKAI